MYFRALTARTFYRMDVSTWLVSPGKVANLTRDLTVLIRFIVIDLNCHLGPVAPYWTRPFQIISRGHLLSASSCVHLPHGPPQ